MEGLISAGLQRLGAPIVAAALLVAGCSGLRPRAAAWPLPAVCRSAGAGSTPAAVQWAAPQDAENRARLDSWCAAVGPVLFRADPAPRADDADGDLRDVAFVSWNVHVGSADIEALVRDLARGRLVGGRRPRHLVLMLQEAVRSDGVPAAIPPGAAAAGWIGSAESIEHGAIDRLARTLGMSVFYAPSMRNGGQSARLPADRGNAILSTLPLFDPSAIEIPGDGQRRVAVAATVRVAAGGADTPLRIATAHLDTLGAARTLWLFGAPAAREAQARALDAALPAGPLVLGADLNSWLGPGEPAARRLLASFPSTPGGRREPTFMAGMVLDYLFFRPPAGWRAHFERVPARYGSDHYPLVGWLTRTADR